MIGIYGIRNIVNNKIYIGSSNDIKRRFRKHRTELNKRKHSNKHLEASYHKYGKDKFDFVILEICERKDLIKKECFYIEQSKSLDPLYGYNLRIPEPHASLVCSTNYSKILSESKKGITPSNFEEMQKKRWKEVEVFVNGNLLFSFPSLRETERQLGIPRGNVYNYLKGKTKSITGFESYHFQYKLQIL